MCTTPSLVYLCLVDFLYVFYFSLFCILRRDIPSHDAGHLVLNPLLFILISNRSAIKGIDGDELEPAELVLVVEAVVALLEEVVLIGVVVLDGDLAFGINLAKECAGVRNDLKIEEAGTEDEDLSKCIIGNQVVINKSLEICERFNAFELAYFFD